MTWIYSSEEKTELLAVEGVLSDQLCRQKLNTQVLGYGIDEN